MAYRVCASVWGSVKAQVWPGLKAVAWGVTAFCLWLSALFVPVLLVILAVNLFTHANDVLPCRDRTMTVYDWFLFLGMLVCTFGLGLSYVLVYRKRRDDWAVRRAYLILLWLVFPLFATAAKVTSLQHQLAAMRPVTVTLRAHDVVTATPLEFWCGEKRGYDEASHVVGVEGMLGGGSRLVCIGTRPFTITVRSEGYLLRDIEIDPRDVFKEIDVGLSRDPVLVPSPKPGGGPGR